MEILKTLFQKIELLRARCDRLHREKLQLQADNKRLLGKNKEAKKRLQDLLKNIENLSK